MTNTRSRTIILLSSLFLLSCSHVPFMNKEATSDSQKKTTRIETARKQQETEPKPGDTRVTDGVEYIYGKNPRYMSSPGEPLYVWMRKDQYSPGLFDSLRSRSPVPTKEEKEMEARIAKLEDELKKTEAQPRTAPQTAHPGQPVSQVPAQPVSVPPVAMISKTPLPTPGPSYPSPRMKRHVLVLPINGATDPKSEQLAERLTNRLIAKLESTGMIICLDPGTAGLQGAVAQPKAMKDLDELHGIQAVVRGNLSDASVISAARISLTVYNAETGLILRQLSSSTGLVTREQDAGSETERMKAIDLGIESIAEDVLKSVLSLNWHARIASTEQGKIFINAGRLSGLEQGDILEVYAPGAQIIDAATKMPLGKLKGEYRGEIEVAELFGVDAAWAKSRRGEHFSPTDLVYLKK